MDCLLAVASAAVRANIQYMQFIVENAAASMIGCEQVDWTNHSACACGCLLVMSSALVW